MNDVLVIDIDRLTAPLTGTGAAGAAGVDLRLDPPHASAYESLKTLYRTARDMEQRAMSGAGEEAARSLVDAKQKWRNVYDGAIELLATKSKDMDIAAWLIAAATRAHGFAGLRDSLRLYRELCERYWDEAHPLPNGERGYSARVAALRGMVGGERALIAPIRMLPIIPGGERDLSAADYNLARQYERYEMESEREAKAQSDGALTLAQFEAIAGAADRVPMDETAELIESAIREVNALEALLDARCPHEENGEPVAPSFTNLRSVLEEQCLHVLRQYCPKQDGTGEAAADDGSPNGSAAGTASARLSANGADPAASREEALQLVLHAAGYFRRTEPHSPVSYALQEVVRWGRTPLPKLMQELVDDESDRKWFFKMVGVKPEES